LKVRDFFRSLKPIELLLRLQGLKKLCKKLSKKPWREKWNLHKRELKKLKREEKERPKREKLRR
jgi:hypothetical protein